MPGFLLGSVMLIFLTGFVPENSHEPVRHEEERHLPSAEPECGLGSGFPESIERWCTLVSYYAGENGLDPVLVASVMLQESGGNDRAYSSSGAVGLLQVMPRDGIAASFYCGGNPCFINRPSMDELFDPEFNIAYGTRMLANLIAKKGSIRDGLFAYGPMDMGYTYADKVLAIYDNHQ